jgi:CRP/FNR family transcriptional regulator, cyclic AMP receptor protein
MNTSALFPSSPIDSVSGIQALTRAIEHNPASDMFSCGLSAQQWEALAAYLQPFALAAGQLLIEEGAKDRAVYFVEEGSLSVHFEDSKGRVRLALLGPGSVVGEGAFFSRQPRGASVQATSACKLWCLSPIRFTELSNRQAAIALELAMGLGGVVAKRLSNRPRRIAVT